MTSSPAVPESTAEPAAGPAPPKLSGLAVAALVTGLIGCVSFLGLVLGIAALLRIRRTGERGRGLAIGGIAAFAAWTAVTAIGVATGTLSFWAATPDAEGRGPLDRAYRIPTQVGQCLTLAGEGIDADTVLTRCEEPHNAQILHSFQLEPGPYPGDEAVQQRATAGCRSAKGRLRTPLPTPPPTLTLAMTYADGRDWERGNRLVVCYVRAAEGTYTGSLLKG